MVIRVHLLRRHHYCQALRPPILSPYFPKLSHYPPIQSRPLCPHCGERCLGAGHLHRLHLPVRSDLPVLGPKELWPVYQYEALFGIYSCFEPRDRYIDINPANICCVEAPDQEVAEDCYIRNLPLRRLVRCFFPFSRQAVEMSGSRGNMNSLRF